MLNIYVGEDKIPAGSVIVKDNEVGFLDTALGDNEVVRSILKNVEHAVYCDNMSFIDRFGYKLYSDFLSTGTKTLLNAYYQTDKVFYGGEMGTSALQEMLKLEQGNIYFDSDFEDFIQPEDELKCVLVNGIKCSNVLEMEDAIYE